MTTPEILESLKNSNITPCKYNPTSSVKTGNHYAITVDNQPILTTGAVGCNKSFQEAKELIESPYFQYVINKAYPNKTIGLSEIKGQDINWNDEEDGIGKSEIGKVEHGNEIGDLVWIVLGEKSLEVSIALCVNNEIQKIAS